MWKSIPITAQSITDELRVQLRNIKFLFHVMEQNSTKVCSNKFTNGHVSCKLIIPGLMVGLGLFREHIDDYRNCGMYLKSTHLPIMKYRRMLCCVQPGCL